MTPKSRMILAGVLGVLSAILVLVIYGQLRPGQQPVVQVTEVIQPFTALTGHGLREVQMDMNTAQTLFPKAFTSLKSVSTRITARQLRPGEILTADDPAIVSATQPERLKQTNSTLSPRVREGYRAVSLDVNGINVAPGDYVDIYVQPKEGTGGRTYMGIQVVAAQGSTLWVAIKQDEVSGLLQAQVDGIVKVAVAPASSKAE